MTIHDFRPKLQMGHEGEAFIDRILNGGLFEHIEQATPAEERLGIDRWVTRYDGSRESVQYKTDERSRQTGNAFLELFHYGLGYREWGWVILCQADWLIYYPRWGDVLLWFRPDILKAVAAELLKNRDSYQVAHNRGYETCGVVLPLAEFQKSATDVMRLAPYETERAWSNPGGSS